MNITTVKQATINRKAWLLRSIRRGTRMYLRSVVLISSLVSLAENKPSLLTMFSHLFRASHPFFTSSWTNYTQLNYETETWKQMKKRNESVLGQHRTQWRLRGSSLLVQTAPVTACPPSSSHPSEKKINVWDFDSVGSVSGENNWNCRWDWLKWNE